MSPSLIGPISQKSITPVLSHRLPLAALMQSQWHARRFLRYDLAMRALTARHLIEGGSKRKNVVAWYQTMQESRAGKDTLEAFQQLIHAIQQEGLSAQYPVGVSAKGELMDGAHRVAVALALGVYDIAVDVRRGKLLRPYGREWFRQKGFPDQALQAMDGEVDRLMATTGADTILLTTSTEDPLHEWIPAYLPPDTEVVREWSVSLPRDELRRLERALTFIPWHEKHKHTEPEPVFGDEPLTVLRLRTYTPKRVRIRKTATAREQGAVDMQRNLRIALPEHPVLVGQTIQHNRDAIAVLSEHGWSHAAGESWPS